MTIVGDKNSSGLNRLPHNALKAFREIAPCCVYIIGVKGEMPLKIGMASDLNKRFQSLQSNTWVKLQIIDSFWFASSMLARNIEADCHKILDKADKRQLNEWFNVTDEWAAKTIRFCAAKRRYAVYNYQEVVDACITVANNPIERGLANRILPAIKEAS